MLANFNWYEWEVKTHEKQRDLILIIATMVISSFSFRGIWLLVLLPFDTFALYFWWLVKLAQIMHPFVCHLYLLFMLCCFSFFMLCCIFSLCKHTKTLDFIICCAHQQCNRCRFERRGERMDYGLLSSELCALNYIESQRSFRSLDWLENYFWRKGKQNNKFKNFFSLFFSGRFTRVHNKTQCRWSMMTLKTWPSKVHLKFKHCF